MNISNEADDKHWYPLPFRVLATSLYVFFMVIGLVGNSLVITVVFRVRGMRTPTNCYLVSLAFSDCLFFLSAMPRELMALHQPQGVYRFGEVACVILTYLPYLAINASSLSNLHDATVEFKRGRRYTKLLASSVPIQDGKKREPMQRESRMYGAAALKGRAQVVKMLVVIVVVFAMCWLPYRALVFYNSFASQAWVNEWFLLVAKIMIVINCAINPILYNLMSAKFRAAFHFFLKGCCTSKQERIRSHSSYRAHNQNMTLRAVNTPSPTGGRVEKQARVSKFVYGSQKARRGHPVTLKKTNSMPPPVE